MAPALGLPNVPDINSRINFGVLDTLVAKQFLDNEQIGSVAEQVGGEGMPPEMRPGVTIQPGAAGIPLHNGIDAHLSDLVKRCLRRHPQGIGAPIDGEWGDTVSAPRKPAHPKVPCAPGLPCLWSREPRPLSNQDRLP